MSDTTTENRAARHKGDAAPTLHGKSLTVRAWIRTSITRLLEARMNLVEAGAMANAVTVPSAARVDPVEHLTSMPAIGSRVRLLRDDWYLSEHHGATIGTIGDVVGDSHLGAGDDNGVLVDWGAGRSVRCTLSELGPMRRRSDEVTA